MLIAGDGSLMTETIYVPIVLAVLLLADVARTARSWWWWVALGIAAGAAALTRQEALLISIVVVVPAAALVRVAIDPVADRSARAHGGRGARGGDPVGCSQPAAAGDRGHSTASPATSLAGSNCDAVYSGPSIGSWDFTCTGSELRTTLPEATWTAQVRTDAIRYARDHAGRLIVVAPAREARVWGIWDPTDLVRRDADETRSERFQYLVWGSGVVTLLAGVAGIVVSVGASGRIAGLVGALTLVATTAVLSYGNPRFRTVAEPALLIGVAVLVVTLARRWRSRSAADPPGASVTTSA